MPDTLKRIQQLSLFFFASNSDEMMASYLALAEFSAAPAVDDWSAVEFCFNHLFVGPRALLAPPYASIYLDGDQTRLMGESTMRVRRLYEMLGLVSPWLNKIPDDHIALELDALWQIESALQHTDSPQLLDAREYLLAHLQHWVAKLIAKIKSVDDVHPAILHVTEILSTVVFSHQAITTPNSVD